MNNENDLKSYIPYLIKVNNALNMSNVIYWLNEKNVDYENMNDLEMYIYYLENFEDEDAIDEIINYSNYKIDESMTIELENSEEGVYVLTLHDIHNVVNKFTNEEITENDILNELTDYKFIKVDNPEIEEINPDSNTNIESGDPDILFDPDKIKKFTEI
jgi:hypothetical protein